MNSRALPTLVAGFAVLALCAKSAAADTTIEDFEANTSLSHWVFSNGPEFPGATGALTRATGHSGSGAHLAYDLSGGGTYVSASLAFDKPLAAGAVGFWVKEPPRSQAKLRLYDSSGQTLEYVVGRPLEAFDASQWFRVVIDVGSPASYYGGANDGVAHAPLTGMSVLSIPEFEGMGAVAGAIDIDDIVIVDRFRASIDPAQPLIAAPPNAADLTKNFAVNVHFTSDDRALDVARSVGFGAVRTDLGWSDIETKRGVYDLSQFDALVAALAARGMRLHLILDYQNTLYPTLDAADFMTVTVPAFANMARAVAQHFAGKNVTYEVWNEPNGSLFWSRSPADYATLCNSTVAAVHAGDPKARVSSGGVSGFDYRFLTAFFAARGGTGADAIGVHPYRQVGGETLAHDWVRIRALLSDNFPANAIPPVWDTEWGYSSSWYGDGHAYDARVQQAQMVARELLSAGSLGLPLVVYYDLRDGGTDAKNAEHNFGLLQNDYTEKPALSAVRTLTSLVKGRTFAGFLQTGQSSLHALRFDGASDRLIAVWWDNPNANAVIELPPHTSGRDMFGAALNLDSSTSSELTLHERYGPVYLSFALSTTSAAIGSGGSTSVGGATQNPSGGSASSVSGALTPSSAGATIELPAAGQGGSADNGDTGSGGAVGSAGARGGAVGPSIDGSGGTGNAASGGTSSGASGVLAADDASMQPASASGCGCTLPGRTQTQPVVALLSVTGLVAGALRRRRKYDRVRTSS